MKLPFYQIDSFTNKVFTGNPAAVVPLQKWLPEETMKGIALENNLPETAFFIANDGGFHLRWFTPTVEMNLCGHATLATAWVIYNEMKYNNSEIIFNSRSGKLTVTKNKNGMTLNFPTLPTEKSALEDSITKAFRKAPLELYKGKNKWVAIYHDPNFILNNNPDLSVIKDLTNEGIIISAEGTGDFQEYDFVSRYFAPQIGIDEDPATGAAHCMLAPIWAEKLNKTNFKARQVSPRGGDLELSLEDNRLNITGQAVLYLKGEIYV